MLILGRDRESAKLKIKFSIWINEKSIISSHEFPPPTSLKLLTGTIKFRDRPKQSLICVQNFLHSRSCIKMLNLETSLNRKFVAQSLFDPINLLSAPPQEVNGNKSSSRLVAQNALIALMDWSCFWKSLLSRRGAFIVFVTSEDQRFEITKNFGHCWSFLLSVYIIINKRIFWQNIYRIALNLR